MPLNLSNRDQNSGHLFYNRRLRAAITRFSVRMKHEFYSLVERHHDGRPDMIGMEAVNQLLVALEVHRFDFCFIGAGYEKEVDEFLTVNPGLAGRFNRKLRFESYSPDEIVEIAIRYGSPGPPSSNRPPETHSTRPAATCVRICPPTAPTASTSCRTAGSPATSSNAPSGCVIHGWRRRTAPTADR